MEIRYNSTWKTKKPMNITIGSHTQNPNGKKIALPEGTILKWDNDAANGNVWFYFTLNGEKTRGKIEAGTILNLIEELELIEMGEGFRAYNEEHVNRYINRKNR